MSRPEVVEYLFGVLSDVLGSAPVSYVKWDMNRNITEPYSLALPADRQGEFFHRYILGVYELYRRLTERFPDILFESCAGGGGRFDAGLLAYAPQAWTSDDTDAAERLAIQWGTSLAYPLSSDGRARRRRPEPPDQPDNADRDARRGGVLRRPRLRARPETLGADDQRAIADQIAFYKTHRDLFQRGRFVRLRSPFEDDGNQTA
jgi:alpha-galactosidase